MSSGYDDGSPNGAYFDAATAAPMHPVARQALLAALDEGWADPGRLYTHARRARQLLDAATAATAEALGVREDEIKFCASGTDAAHLAIAGGLGMIGGLTIAPGQLAFTGLRGRATGEDPHRAGVTFVHSAVEHSAVLYAAARHETSGGGSAVAVPVDRYGRVDLDAFADAVRAPGVGLAALISASHEVGTLQPVTEAAEVCAAEGVPLYVDAAQSVGRVPVPPGWSILTASAHKWGGPPGVGVLAVRGGARFEQQGPPHGPLNLPAVVAAAASLRAALTEADAEAKRLSALVDRVRTTVAATVPDVEVVGDPTDRLPHIVTFSCLYVDGEALLHALDRRGFAVSSGSACTAATLRPSHVLEAMGVLTHGNVRISLHREVDEEDVDRFLAVLPETVAALRAEAGAVGL